MPITLLLLKYCSKTILERKYIAQLPMDISILQNSFLQNINIYLQVHMASQPRTITLSGHRLTNSKHSKQHHPSWKAKCLTLHGTPIFITMFTRVHHQSLFWAGWIQSTASNPISLRSNYAYVFCLIFSLQASHTNCCTHFSSPCVLHDLPISSSSFNWSS